MTSFYPSRRIATVIEPSVRDWIDTAIQGDFQTIHVDNVSEVLSAVRERSVQVVLVSPNCVSHEELPRVARLTAGFPGIPTVALIATHDRASSARLLELGAHGVRKLVDLSAREGWEELRNVVTHPSSPTAARILARVLPELGEPTGDCRHLFEMMVQMAPSMRTVRALAQFFNVRPSTFMSRFWRARLPSPKGYLAATRLLYASALLETRGFSISDVAYRLEYSSPQSFGRHLRTVLGITASEFRHRFSFDIALSDYLTRLIAPYRGTFRTFHPLERGVGYPGRY